MVEQKFFSGKTEEQAVLAAARHYQVEPERVAYSTRDKKHGFLKVGRKVVIEVDPANPMKPENEAEPAVQSVDTARSRPVSFPGDPDTPPSHEEPEEVWWDEEDTSLDDLEATERAVTQLVDLAGLEIEWTIRRGDDEIEVDFAGEDAEILKEDGGKLLHSIEHLLPRVVRGWSGRGIPCKVDCENFRADHEEELADQALDTADTVRSTGTPQTLEPMSPADRRIIHITLADDPDVETESEGDGFFKRVRVKPVV